MNIVNTVLGNFGLAVREVKVSDRPSIPDWVSAGNSLFSYDNTERVLDYAEIASRYTIHDLTYMCGNRLGDMAAGSQLMLFPPDAPILETGEFDPSSAIPVDDHPFYDLWKHPNMHAPRADFLKQLTLSTFLSQTGSYVHLDVGERDDLPRDDEGFLVIPEPTTDKIESLWVLFPDNVSYHGKKKSSYFVFDRKDGTPRFKFPFASIMWTKDYNPLDPLSSLSKMTPSNMAYQFDMNSQKANTNLFKQGMRPGPIIESDRDFVDPNELQLIQKMWDEQMKGVDNWHKLLPLWAGFKLSRYGFSPSEAEYIQGSKLARMRIFGTWGVHPGIIFTEDVNRANAEVGEFVTRKFTLAPFLSRIATSITLNILPFYKKPAVAQFVNVVPADEEKSYNVAMARGRVAEVNANATKAWVELLGPKHGAEEAIRLGVLSEEAVITELVKSASQPAPPTTKPSLNGSGRKEESTGGNTEEETDESPAKAAAKSADPLLLSITQDDLEAVESLLEKSFPSYRGLLTKTKKG